jgi:hypothetical protein
VATPMPGSGAALAAPGHGVGHPWPPASLSTHSLPLHPKTSVLSSNPSLATPSSRFFDLFAQSTIWAEICCLFSIGEWLLWLSK